MAVDAQNLSGEGGDSAAGEQDEIDAEERTTSFEEREARVAGREARAQARTALADERDVAADERERIADERESLADERERIADERERLADEREHRLNALEGRLDARARSVGVPTETVPERVLEAIARGRALLAASSTSLDRSQAAVERQRERATRHQGAVDREATESEDLLESGPASGTATERNLAERGERLRQQFLGAASELVQVEERMARYYENSGTTDPRRRARHAKIAEEAREAARHARLAGPRPSRVRLGNRGPRPRGPPAAVPATGHAGPDRT